MVKEKDKPLILETERLYLREMKQTDFQDLAEILQNPKVMYAYEHDFSKGYYFLIHIDGL